MRISTQVFTKQGKYMREFLVAPRTPSRGAICNPEKFGMCGSTYNLTLSHDPGQHPATSIPVK